MSLSPALTLLTLTPDNCRCWRRADSAPDGWGCDCKNGTSKCNVGQACFWFSQGTTIGCEHATGAPSNPNTKSFCNSTMKATVNDPTLRTYNRAAAAGTAADLYKHNPWRAPGSAPVFHPCGMAGGGPHQQGGEAEYTPTKIAKQGDPGSVLPYTPTGDFLPKAMTVYA